MKTFEYTKINTEDDKFCKELKNCDKEEFLDKLFRYLDRQKYSEALKRGHQEIQTQNYVGTIKYKNFQLDILPKMLKYGSTEKEEDYKNVLNNLTFMLSYTKNLEIKATNTGKISESKNPFLEILIREYSQSLFDCLKRLTPKKYVREEDNLNFMKGKLKFSENIRYNCSNQARFYCEFDEFSENNILNQLFLFVAICLKKVSQDSKNKKLLGFIINYYCDVDFVEFDRYKADKIKLSKNQEMFKKPFNLAKMFVQHSSVDLSRNRLENVTLLWDMNILFEEFICEIIKKHTKYNPKYQKGRRLLIDDYSKKKYGNTFIDMYVEKDGQKIILDTKYKLNSGEHNEFNNKDVYQIMTYCLIHDTKNAVLIYPLEKEDSLNSNTNKFYLNTEYADIHKKEDISTNMELFDNMYKLFSVQLNLKTDLRENLKSDDESINIAKHIEKQLDTLIS